jgi:ribosomal protein S18 acetylase RimI-like enzyme
MGVPEDWDLGPGMTLECGHIYEGRTVALHSLAVSPTCQRKGYGKALMRAYLDLLKKSGEVDRVSILTYDRLVEYYSRQGFELLGKSEATYAGVDWYDLVSFTIDLR